MNDSVLPNNSISSVNSNIFSNQDDYFIEGSYINDEEINSLRPNNINVDNLAIKRFIEYDDKNIRDQQYITYIDHPNIILNSREEKEEEEKEKNDDQEEKGELHNLNMISKFYFGSITIIGLYIFFKLLQRSR